MPSLGTVTLAGKTGKAHKFRVYPLGTVFKKGLAGVFVLTERTLRDTTGSMRHRPLFVGQSGDLRQPHAGAANALTKGSANCICVCAEPDAGLRQGIQEDLGAGRLRKAGPQ